MKHKSLLTRSIVSAIKLLNLQRIRYSQAQGKGMATLAEYKSRLKEQLQIEVGLRAKLDEGLLVLGAYYRVDLHYQLEDSLLHRYAQSVAQDSEFPAELMSGMFELYSSPEESRVSVPYFRFQLKQEPVVEQLCSIEHIDRNKEQPPVLQLSWEAHDGRGPSGYHELKDGMEFTVGRAGSRCDVQIDHPCIRESAFKLVKLHEYAHTVLLMVEQQGENLTIRQSQSRREFQPMRMQFRTAELQDGDQLRIWSPNRTAPALTLRVALFSEQQ